VSGSSNNLVLDTANKPAPQFDDEINNKYQYLKGINGASSVNRGRWYQVGASATITSIPMTTESGLTLLFTAAAQNRMVNGTAILVLGTQQVEAIVTAVSSAGTLTLDSALPSAPVQGAWIMVVPPEETSLTGSNATIGNVGLNGRTAIKTVIFNALAIADTTVHYSTSVDVSGYKDWFLYVNSSLNEPPQFTPNIYNVGAIWPDGTDGGVTISTPNVNWLITQQKWVGAEFTDFLQFGVGCTTAPTSGSFSAALVGVPN